MHSHRSRAKATVDGVLPARGELLQPRYRDRAPRRRAGHSASRDFRAGRVAEIEIDDRRVHEQSHGESFLALLKNRFGPNGLYILDEPEAALSPSRQLALLVRMHDLVEGGSQFIIATHAPIVLAYPGATIYHLDDRGMRAVEYDQTEHVQLTRDFLNDRERFVTRLLDRSGGG